MCCEVRRDPQTCSRPRSLALGTTDRLPTKAALVWRALPCRDLQPETQASILAVSHAGSRPGFAGEGASVSARILTLSESEYFADKGSEVPRLSQSTAHTLVSRSPLHAWLSHPRLGAGDIADHTKAKDDGSILSKLLLGKGADFEVIVADDFRTKAAQQARDLARLNGRIPVLERVIDELRKTAETLRAKLAARGYEFTGESEVPLEWEEQGTEGPVLCRGRPDHIILDAWRIFDVKKILSAHPLTIRRHMYEYGYDIQWAAYTSAVSKLRPDVDHDPEFIFLFMEIQPPYAITPINMARCEAFREIGRMRWARAVELWERCLLRDEWPEYVDGETGVEPMPYVMNEEIGSGNW